MNGFSIGKGPGRRPRWFPRAAIVVNQMQSWYLINSMSLCSPNRSVPVFLKGTVHPEERWRFSDGTTQGHQSSKTNHSLFFLRWTMLNYRIFNLQHNVDFKYTIGEVFTKSVLCSIIVHWTHNHKIGVQCTIEEVLFRQQYNAHLSQIEPTIIRLTFNI